MGMNAAVKAREILDRFQTILAIELLSACQGLELSRNPVPERLRPILRRVRSVVPRLEQDRELGPDIEKVKGLLATLS